MRCNYIYVYILCAIFNLKLLIRYIYVAFHLTSGETIKQFLFLFLMLHFKYMIIQKPMSKEFLWNTY